MLVKDFASISDTEGEREILENSRSSGSIQMQMKARSSSLSMVRIIFAGDLLRMNLYKRDFLSNLTKDNFFTSSNINPTKNSPKTLA